MEPLSELFWKASPEEMARGYFESVEEDAFVCLLCGARFERGVIYPAGERLLEAGKYAAYHVYQEHGGVFDFLINLNKKFTGLTDLQKSLLVYFRQGMKDAEIVKALGGGSSSTIRNHRFTFREREKQARVYLAIMSLLSSPEPQGEFLDSHLSARMVDDRFAITREEGDKILGKYFPQGPQGPLSEFPSREKRKLVVLRNLARRFEMGREYTEAQVNEILQQAYHDFVTLRRYMIEYGFMDRKPDCSVYWMKP